MLKRIILCALLSPLLLAGTALAVNPVGGQEGSVCEQNPEAAVCQAESRSGSNLLGRGGLFTKIAQAFVFITAIISVIVVIVGGIKYAISGGDPNNIQAAKNAVIYALVGLAIAIFAQAIVSFVLSRL